MTADLRDSLAQAASAGRTRFDSVDVDAVIAPATRRVRRHRAAVSAVSAIGAVALVGGVMWGVDAVTTRDALGIDPAGQATPTPAPDVAHSAEPWTITDLLAVAEPRAKGEERAYSTAAMICNHDNPEDDPRVAYSNDPAVSHAMTIEDCNPVWLQGSAAYLTPVTSFVTTSASGDTATLTYRYELRNDSSWALALDTDSVFMWVEMDPEGEDQDLSVYSHTIIGGTMWDGAGSVTALLDSSQQSRTIQPGYTWSGTLSVTVDSDDALYPLLTAGGAYQVSLWGRVHEDTPMGKRSVVVQLGGAFDSEVDADTASADDATTLVN